MVYMWSCEDATKKVLKRWLGPGEDWAEEFNSIDMTNKKGDGNVLFRVSWRNFIFAFSIQEHLSIAPNHMKYTMVLYTRNNRTWVCIFLKTLTIRNNLSSDQQLKTVNFSY